MTVTTTPTPTCSGFTCPSGMLLRPQPGSLLCFSGSCDESVCCLAATTTAPCGTEAPPPPKPEPSPCTTGTPPPPAPAPPPPAPTCAGFTCPATMKLRPQPERLKCDYAGCSEQVCCLETSPCTTLAPVRLNEDGIAVAVAGGAAAPQVAGES